MKKQFLKIIDFLIFIFWANRVIISKKDKSIINGEYLNPLLTVFIRSNSAFI